MSRPTPAFYRVLTGWSGFVDFPVTDLAGAKRAANESAAHIRFLPERDKYWWKAEVIAVDNNTMGDDHTWTVYDAAKARSEAVKP